jgi:uncharacterized ParB-like nuclease family protein
MDERAERAASAARNETAATADNNVITMLRANDADYQKINGLHATMTDEIPRAACPLTLSSLDPAAQPPLNGSAGQVLTAPQPGSPEIRLLAFMLRHDTNAVNLVKWRELRTLWSLAGSEFESCHCGRCASLTGHCWRHALQLQCPMPGNAARQPSCNEAQGTVPQPMRVAPHTRITMRIANTISLPVRA